VISTMRSGLQRTRSHGLTRARPASIRFLLAVAATIFAVSIRADTFTATYPRSYQSIVDAAKQEQVLQIYSNVHSDLPESELLANFKKLYPFISIRYLDEDGSLVYQRFIDEVAAHRPTADVIWSSAMDLQEKLINDGYAQPYSSPELPSIPSWAHWKDLGYGSTSEPIVFVYNRRFISAKEVPSTHAALQSLLEIQAPRFRGRVAIYDPEKSEVGMLFLSQDLGVSRDAWSLFKAFADVDAKGYTTSRDILRHVVQGDQWIGYDVIASYAFEIQKSHPELEVVYPTDYVLTVSRVCFITTNALHPNAAKLFLDFLLSRRGQSSLVNRGMGSVRSDISSPVKQGALNPVRTQTIRIGPGLLAGLDSLVRAQFLRRWRQMRAPKSATL
jgi:iron(III) transport system substrate-binding protein